MAGAGIVSGFDMTSEAALAKLSYVLGQPGLSLDDRKKVCTPLARLQGLRALLGRPEGVFASMFWKWKGNSLWEDRANADPVHPGYTLIILWGAL